MQDNQPATFASRSLTQTYIFEQIHQKNDSKDMESLQHGINEEKGVLFCELLLTIPFKREEKY